MTVRSGESIECPKSIGGNYRCNEWIDVEIYSRRLSTQDVVMTDYTSLGFVLA